METRKIGKTGIEASIFGFGAMRLPRTADGEVDREETIRMTRYAIDNGVTYVDTAYPYEGGLSEEILGDALADGYRERITLTTKSPIWDVHSEADFDRILDEQLAKLKVSYVDCYLCHALAPESWKELKEIGILNCFARAKESGKVRNIGFSTHTDTAGFKELIDDYDWDLAQVQMNYLDVENQVGLEGIRYAGQKGLSVIVMEPLRGGRLANPPKEVFEVFGSQYSPVEWAFNFLRGIPEVAVVLSGVSSMEQLKDTMRIFTEQNIDPDVHKEVYLRAKEAFDAKMKVPCTACRYCMPCPAGVNIPRAFGLWNDMALFDDSFRQEQYEALRGTPAEATNCVECRACVEKCPQHIDIPEMLKMAHEELTGPRKGNAFSWASNISD